MKHGGDYAKRLRQLFNRLVRKFGKPTVPEPPDPLEQLLVAILGSNTSHHKALTAFKKLREQMVDLNELRVTPVSELARIINPLVPQAEAKAQRIVDALNDIRRRHDTLDLSFLKQRGRREAREYLESLEGVDRYAAASVALFSLGSHAIPVDELTLQMLRKDEVVAPTADLPAVQSFLEHHISASDAAVFSLLLGHYAASRGLRLLDAPVGEPVDLVGSEEAARPSGSVSERSAADSGDHGLKRPGGGRTAGSSAGRPGQSFRREKPPRSSPTAGERARSPSSRTAKAGKRK
ncbi:MAG: endonuclease III domain-containing protein [Phycisphaerae bacterium]